MNRFRTDRSDGFIELMFALVLLGLILGGIQMVYPILLQKGRLERASWSHAISIAHGSLDDPARSHAEEVFSPTERRSITWNKSLNCRREIANGLSAAEDLPKAFLIALPLNCGSDVTVIGHFSAEVGLKSKSFVPGGSFRKNALLKHALWQEAMTKAGFPTILPLELLGTPELASAVGLGGIAHD